MAADRHSMAAFALGGGNNEPCRRSEVARNAATMLLAARRDAERSGGGFIYGVR